MLHPQQGKFPKACLIFLLCAFSAKGRGRCDAISQRLHNGLSTASFLCQSNTRSPPFPLISTVTDGGSVARASIPLCSEGRCSHMTLWVGILEGGGTLTACGVTGTRAACCPGEQTQSFGCQGQRGRSP